MDREPIAARISKHWPEIHPLISLAVLIVIGLAFVVWTGMVGGVDYFTDWF
jgi:hypothetical protein